MMAYIDERRTALANGTRIVRRILWSVDSAVDFHGWRRVPRVTISSNTRQSGAGTAISSITQGRSFCWLKSTMPVMVGLTLLQRRSLSRGHGVYAYPTHPRVPSVVDDIMSPLDESAARGAS